MKIKPNVELCWHLIVNTEELEWLRDHTQNASGEESKQDEEIRTLFFEAAQFALLRPETPK